MSPRLGHYFTIVVGENRRFTKQQRIQTIVGVPGEAALYTKTRGNAKGMIDATPGRRIQPIGNHRG